VDVFVTIALISLFAYLSISILAPFISMLLWAVILAVGLYPLYEKLRAAIGGSAGWAATVIGLAGLLLLLVPAFFVVDSMIESLGDWSRTLRAGGLPIPPPSEAVKSWPLIGSKLYDLWAAADIDLKATLEQFEPQLEKAALFLLGMGAGLVGDVLKFALSIVFAAIFLSFAQPLVNSMQRLAGRIASSRGKMFVDMAGSTIRNVSRGVLGVAVIQGGLAAIGMLVAGLPFAGFLAAAAIAACIVQVPIIVFLPAIILAWSVESTTVALIFTIYMIPVTLIDNFLKPILMARGLDTPMPVIFIGVIGGTLTNGLLGLFIGPVILALFYKMILIWVASAEKGTGA
jgi:predicted PurR-regulated permease PerM